MCTRIFKKHFIDFIVIESQLNTILILLVQKFIFMVIIYDFVWFEKDWVYLIESFNLLMHLKTEKQYTANALSAGYHMVSTRWTFQNFKFYFE